MKTILPNVWGPGAMFAASGYDGTTDFTCPFVGRLLEEAPGMEIMGDLAEVPYAASGSFGFPWASIARFHVQAPGLTLANFDRDRSVVAGDWILLAQGDAEIEFLAFAPGVFHLRTRHLPDAEFVWSAAHPPLTFAGAGSVDGVRESFEGRIPLSPGESEWVLVLRYPWQENGDIGSLVRRVWSGAARRREEIRNGFSRIRVPAGMDDARQRTYAKAASVLRLNVESPQGKFTTRWTTPDKYPHRHLWLWDSAFHALGWLHLDPDMAWEALRAVLERTEPDGFIPICANPFQEHRGGESQPPILGWSLAKILAARDRPRKDRAFAYAALSRFLQWIRRNRAWTGSGLLGWRKAEDHPRCRCGESGWDNSPRFDHDGPDDHIDLCSFVVRELEVLRDLAADLELGGEAEAHERERLRMAALVNRLLWCDEDGLYYDRSLREGLVRMKTAACFFPLFAGIADERQADRLTAHLMDEELFLTAVPVPSMSPSERGYEKDMWRGPTWVNCNYLVIEGLRRYGRIREAEIIRERTLSEIARWYQRIGCIMEYFDCEGVEDPRFMLRKGSRTEGARVIRDYGWSAAVYIALANMTAQTAVS